MAYKHIIWDWNGTLLNDRLFCIEIMNGVLRRRNMKEMTESWFLDNFTFPVIEYYRKLGFDFEKEPFSVSGSEFIQDYMARLHEPDLHEGVHQTLGKIEASGITQSLLSAASQTMLDSIIHRHEIDGYFLKIIGQDDHYAYGKEEAGKAWMDQLHYGPHEVLFVGDTLHDLDVANAIGADCVLLSHGHASREKLEKSGRDVYDNLEDLGLWLQSLK